MNITVLCSSCEHPVYPVMERWAAERGARLAQKVAELEGGDFLFLISCGEIVKPDHRAMYRHSLVLHASDLPHGRGWSPHVWGIIEGLDCITLSMLDAQDPVDSGNVWRKLRIPLDGTELYDEINDKLFAAEVELMDWALENCDRTKPEAQTGVSSYYRRRTPADGEVQPDQSLAEIFDLLRVSDPTRFPAFLTYRGQRYALGLRKL